MLRLRGRVSELTVRMRNRFKSSFNRVRTIRNKYKSTTETNSKEELIAELNESLQWEHECGKRQGEKTHGTFRNDSRPTYFYSEIENVKILFAPINDLNIQATHDKKTDTYTLEKITAEVTAPNDELVVNLYEWKLLGTYFAANELNDCIGGRIPIRFKNDVPEFDSAVVSHINRELVNTTQVHKPVTPSKSKNIKTD